jgi:hypothetical protein
MRTRKRPLRPVGFSPRTVSRQKESMLSHLVSKVAIALAEIEAIQEARGHHSLKSRRIAGLYAAE